MSDRVPSTAFADAWIQVDRTEDPRFFVSLLDATRAELLGRAERSPSEFFAPIEPRPGHRVLDVGCGTGDFLRLLARMIEPGGAVGVDLSETMIAEARHRSGAVLSNLTFQTADVHALPFDDASFDRVLATQVLLHVTDPGRALADCTAINDRKPLTDSTPGVPVGCRLANRRKRRSQPMYDASVRGL